MYYGFFAIWLIWLVSSGIKRRITDGVGEMRRSAHQDKRNLDTTVWRAEFFNADGSGYYFGHGKAKGASIASYPSHHIENFAVNVTVWVAGGRRAGVKSVSTKRKTQKRKIVVLWLLSVCLDGCRCIAKGVGGYKGRKGGEGAASNVVISPFLCFFTFFSFSLLPLFSKITSRKKNWHK